MAFYVASLNGTFHGSQIDRHFSICFFPLGSGLNHPEDFKSVFRKSCLWYINSLESHSEFLCISVYDKLCFRGTPFVHGFSQGVVPLTLKTSSLPKFSGKIIQCSTFQL